MTVDRGCGGITAANMRWDIVSRSSQRSDQIGVAIETEFGGNPLPPYFVELCDSIPAELLPEFSHLPHPHL